MHKVKAFTQLSQDERSKIEVLLHQGLSYSAIGSLLGRCTSTISREIKRNSRLVYKASAAQLQTEKRHRQKPKRIIFDDKMKAYICQQLFEKKWSPEIISVLGRIECSERFVSHERIYQWIWHTKFSQAGADKPYSHLYEYLRHASRKRKRGNRRRMRGNILERRWIDERPAEANSRSTVGHLEADIMLGKDRQPGLLVALERKTRKAWVRKLKNKDSGYVMRLLSSICKECSGVKTVTFDNDQSFAQHYRLNRQGIQTYFTHPYSSQEKGSVENRIGLIRMFFGKKTEFTKVSSKHVKKVERLINERPLRMFNYRSPNEIFEKDRPLH